MSTHRRPPLPRYSARWSAAVRSGVQQVADVPDAADLAGALAQLVDLLLVGQLAAQLDDAVVDVHRHLALGRVGGAEQLGLDLAGERDVVVVLAAGDARRRAFDLADGLAAVELGEHDPDRGGDADRAGDLRHALARRGPAARLALHGPACTPGGLVTGPALGALLRCRCNSHARSPCFGVQGCATR